MSLARRSVLRLPLAFAGLSAPALARPPGGALGRILASGRLRAGVWLGSSPFGLRAPDGQLVGMEVEVARDIARALGVEADLVPLASGERVSAVALRHVDIACATIIITPDRLRRVAFAHAHGQISIVLATTGRRPIAGISELSGRRVLGRSGVVESMVGLLPPDTDRVVIEDYQEGLDQLLAGDAAALVLPSQAFRRLALDHPAAQLQVLKTLAETPYAVALPLRELDLLQFLNTWVFLREQDGTLASLHETFFTSTRAVMPRL